MNIWEILNSNFFCWDCYGSCCLVAFRLYKKQKSDLKINAAKIILLEIQNAERSLKREKGNTL